MALVLPDTKVPVPEQAVGVGIRHVRAVMEGNGVHRRYRRRLDSKPG